MKRLFCMGLFLIQTMILFAQSQIRDDAGQQGGIAGFYETYNPINFPVGAAGWWHWLDVRHGNVNNNFSMQFAGSFYDQNLWFRKTDNVANREWSRVITETNGVLNGKLYMSTPNGQSFYVGHQAGPNYTYPNGIFRAEMDNPSGLNNTYFEGLSAGVRRFSVRGDGQGFFQGSLGVGTDHPVYKLEVAGGDIKAYNYDHATGISIGAESTERPRIGFHVSDNSRRFKLEVNGINSTYERLGVFSTNGGAGGDTELMSFNKTGKIGIGEQNPQSRLHLTTDGSGKDGGNNYAYNGDGLVIEAKTGGRKIEAGAQLEFVIPAGTAGDNPWGQGRIITVAGNPDPTNATGKMILGTRRMFNKLNSGQQWYYGDDIVIDGVGNVGIGTLTPKEKLSIYGGIRAIEVKVSATDWPDYVFEEGFKIESLRALESYIEVNKHLPDIPSAKEVEKEGVALGEMNKLLLKKIEELTLHLIDQQKQLTAQHELLVRQSAQLTTLDQKLNKRLKKQ
ncbi:hypothetical protein [Pedobacter frigidisoli]|uniref:hypothetical protein n=1 Tax=Pedobacter frigidisoli TaxID=2530455 RepID=UPI00292DBBF9|nr:hypothetical protein [Pedobacter frigidisoli]